MKRILVWGVTARAIRAIVLAVAGCAEATSPSSVPVDRVSSAWVTGRAAAALSADGFFKFRDTVGADEVASDTAVAIASAYMLGAATSPLSVDFRKQVEQLRGAAIDWKSLHPCRVPVLARAVYGPFPDTVSVVLLRTVAGRWVVPFCEASGAQSMIGEVSTLATNIHVVGAGIVFDSTIAIRGGEIQLYPQLAASTGLNLSAEKAAELAFVLTGRRVSEVPRAFQRGTSTGALYVATAARWQVALEDTVSLVTSPSGQRSTTSIVWIERDSSFRARVVLATAVQPSHVPFLTAFGDSAGALLTTIQVPLRQPIVFEQAARP